MRVYTSSEMMKQSKTMFVEENKSIGDIAPHTHDFVELVYILSGKAVHTVDGRSYNLSRGDILFMNCGCVHSFVSENEHTYVNILFSPEIIGENIVTNETAFSLFSLTAFNQMRNDSEFGKISFFGDERLEIENIIRSMLTEYRGKQTYWERSMRNYLNNLIIKMLRKNETGFEPCEIDGMWRELSAYIDENLGEKLTLSDLAEKCFYNPSYFSRVFKEKFGVSLVEYITKKRIAYAVDLLQSTDMPIEEISEKVGFSDRNSFYHAFSRYMNRTPSSYRGGKVKKADKMN